MITPSVSAQGITRVSKLPSGPEIGLDDQPTASNDNGEDTEEGDGGRTGDDEDTEPTGDEDNQSTDEEEDQTTTTVDNETDSNAPPERVVPKGLVGDLTPGNVSDLNVSPVPSYKMKIIFDFILPLEDHEGAFSGCGEYDLTAFVQGKRVSLTDATDVYVNGQYGGNLWDVCDDDIDRRRPIHFKPGTEVTVEIPMADTPFDAQPLSIFTVGTEIDGCMRATLPSNLNKVQQVLADKGTTRPYYEGVKEKIAKIQSDINSQLPLAGCLGNPSLINDNDLLGTINEIYYPPGYGKLVGPNGPNNPGSNQAMSSTSDFVLYWKVDCPLCAGIRQH